MLFIVSKDYLISSYVLPSLMAGIWMLRRLRRSKTCEIDVQKKVSIKVILLFNKNILKKYLKDK